MDELINATLIGLCAQITPVIGHCVCVSVCVCTRFCVVCVSVCVFIGTTVRVQNNRQVISSFIQDPTDAHMASRIVGHKNKESENEKSFKLS